MRNEVRLSTSIVCHHPILILTGCLLRLTLLWSARCAFPASFTLSRETPVGRLEQAFSQPLTSWAITDPLESVTIGMKQQGHRRLVLTLGEALPRRPCLA